MIENLDEFISKIEGFEELHPNRQCDFFVLYLTEFEGKSGVRPKDIEGCFNKLRLKSVSNISRYLSTNTSGPTPKFLKEKDAYHIERKLVIKLKGEIKLDKPFLEVNKNLRSLLSYLKNNSEQTFLEEAIKCFEVQAFRPSIVMVWILTIDHMYEFIITNKLTEFNAALARVTDRRIRVTTVASKDDFSDIPEGKFIEITRSAGIISNDVRKILDEKLGIRNSAAHPSNITIGRGKTFDFIEDLINNVILKY